MNKKENFGSQYMYAEDLLSKQRYQSMTATISEVIPPNTLKSADGKLIDKWCIEFKDFPKRLALCSTNVRVIHLSTGDPVGPAWKGRAITMEARMVESFGDIVVAVRVIPPKGCMIPKKVLKRIGEPAVWAGPVDQPKSESKVDIAINAYNECQTQERFDKLQERIDAVFDAASDADKVRIKEAVKLAAGRVGA